LNEQKFSFTVSGEDKQRLDKFLVNSLPQLSRARIQALIKEGFVQVNGQEIVKTGYQLESGERVDVRQPAPVETRLVSEEIPLDIIFENDDLILVNKPAGMVVHPSAGHASGTLVHAALAHAPEMEGVGGVHRPGIVHRLDKNTSGLILLAKNDRAHQWLQRQFKERKVVKIYDALVDGRPPTPKGRVEAPIGRDPSHRQKMAVVPLAKGREAYTEYFTEKQYIHHTLLKVHLLTGRTHQIRVHMAFLKTPIVGDSLYGFRHPSLPVERQFLHAGHLEICLPGEGKASVFDAPLPADLARALDGLE